MYSHGPEVDTSQLYVDEVLERELRDAVKSEGEIELFKLVAKGMRVRDEVANTESVRLMLSQMWGNVADFFETVTEASTLAGLAADDKLVVQHQLMKANFAVVAGVNSLFKQASEAEADLIAADQMGQDLEKET